jgi:hypothetical protein
MWMAVATVVTMLRRMGGRKAAEQKKGGKAERQKGRKAERQKVRKL